MLQFLPSTLVEELILLVLCVSVCLSVSAVTVEQIDLWPYFLHGG